MFQYRVVLHFVEFPSRTAPYGKDKYAGDRGRRET